MNLQLCKSINAPDSTGNAGLMTCVQRSPLMSWPAGRQFVMRCQKQTSSSWTARTLACVLINDTNGSLLIGCNKKKKKKQNRKMSNFQCLIVLFVPRCLRSSHCLPFGNSHRVKVKLTVSSFLICDRIFSCSR